MEKYRIKTHGVYGHIFDVQVKKWYGWVLVKRFKADVSSNDTMIDNIYYSLIPQHFDLTLFISS